MPMTDRPAPGTRKGVTKPSEEFADFCEAEFERRLNSGVEFNETLYRKAMLMVMDRLTQLEEEGAA
ncbi:hypothetical protein [Thiosocius teredinicola]|uniref:hypothetical protein n=1 Tax=Thiosocius teredinicola TaxID=1973002 RepID=UPI000990FDB2